MHSLETQVNGKTKVLALLGYPVEHTLSPIIHNTLSKLLDHNLIYVPFSPKPAFLGEAVMGMKATHVLGFNITVPYKTDIMQYLDVVAEDAALMGAVNTVHCKEDKLFGYNTDGEGFIRAFQKRANISLKDKTILLLGAGGTARSIAVKLAQEGVKAIFVVNRTLSHARDIIDVVNAKVNPVATAYSLDHSQMKLLCRASDIIVNTSVIGMHPYEEESLIQPEWLSQHHIVFDVIYSPAKTKLLQLADANGALAINGLGMLLYQAVKAYEIWTQAQVSDCIVEQVHQGLNQYL